MAHVGMGLEFPDSAPLEWSSCYAFIVMKQNEQQSSYIRFTLTVRYALTVIVT